MKDWDKKLQKVRTSHGKASLINSMISERKSDFDNYLDNCIRNKKEPKLFHAIRIVNGTGHTTAVTKLTDAYELYIQRIGDTHNKGTKAKYTTMMDQIAAYELYRRTRVNLDDVNEEFFLDFINYCINQRGNHNATIRRKLKNIKTVMRFTVVKKLFDGRDWETSTKLKEVETARIPLNAEERQAVWSWSTTDMFERRVIDAFIFAMYTGLRFSDLKQLSTVHCFFNEGQWYMDLSLVKGNKDHIVGIPEFLYERMKHYFGSGKLFNLTDSQSGNRVIKRMARGLKLDRQFEGRELQGSTMTKTTLTLCNEITWHFARYTFTRMLDDSGMQATDIQKNLRHAKFTTTERYLRADDMRRVQDSNKRLSI